MAAEQAPLLHDDESEADKPKGGLEYLVQKGLGDAAELAGLKKKKRKKKKRKKKPVSCWKLIFSFKFLFFFFNCFVCIGIAFWYWILTDTGTGSDNLIPYISSGVIGIIISLYGYKSFAQLMELTHEANEFGNKVAKMSSEKKRVKFEVSKINHANYELRDTENRLRIANQKNRDNLTQFRSVQQTMKQLDVKSFQKIRKKAINAEQKWHRNLLAQERDMLHLIFDRFEMRNDNKNNKNNKNNKTGMNKNEFEQFAQLLPNQYIKRFHRLGTFAKLSNNKGILEYADFEMVLDLFAEMVVDNVDIEFNVDHNNNNKNNNNNNNNPLAMILNDSVSSDSSDSSSSSSVAFLTKLTTWRKTKKKEKIRQSQNINRSLVITTRTPTTPRNQDNNNNNNLQTVNTTDNHPDSDDFNDADIDAYMKATLRGNNQDFL